MRLLPAAEKEVGERAEELTPHWYRPKSEDGRRERRRRTEVTEDTEDGEEPSSWLWWWWCVLIRRRELRFSRSPSLRHQY